MGRTFVHQELSHVHAARALCRQISSEVDWSRKSPFLAVEEIGLSVSLALGGKLLHLDHVTVPVTDLRVAEDF